MSNFLAEVLLPADRVSLGSLRKALMAEYPTEDWSTILRFRRKSTDFAGSVSKETVEKFKPLFDGLAKGLNITEPSDWSVLATM